MNAKAQRLPDPPPVSAPSAVYNHAAPSPASRLVNRNVVAARGRTSMRLEPELWDALADICVRENLSLGEIIHEIEAMGHPGGRTSAVRVYIVQYYRRRVALRATRTRLAG